VGDFTTVTTITTISTITTQGRPNKADQTRPTEQGRPNKADQTRPIKTRHREGLSLVRPDGSK